MTIHSHFPDPFASRLYGHRKGQAVWIVTHYFRYCNPEHPIITVPCGSLTDGASVPKAFHNILGPSGTYFRAAVIHDFLYSLQSNKYCAAVTREMADRIFLDAMVDCGVGWFTRSIIYRTVRTFGWACYKKPESPIDKV